MFNPQKRGIIGQKRGQQDDQQDDEEDDQQKYKKRYAMLFPQGKGKKGTYKKKQQNFLEIFNNIYKDEKSNFKRFITQGDKKIIELFLTMQRTNDFDSDYTYILEFVRQIPEENFIVLNNKKKLIEILEETEKKYKIIMKNARISTFHKIWIDIPPYRQNEEDKEKFISFLNGKTPEIKNDLINIINDLRFVNSRTIEVITELNKLEALINKNPNEPFLFRPEEDIERNKQIEFIPEKGKVTNENILTEFNNILSNFNEINDNNRFQIHKEQFRKFLNGEIDMDNYNKIYKDLMKQVEMQEIQGFTPEEQNTQREMKERLIQILNEKYESLQGILNTPEKQTDGVLVLLKILRNFDKNGIKNTRLQDITNKYQFIHFFDNTTRYNSIESVNEVFFYLKQYVFQTKEKLKKEETDSKTIIADLTTLTKLINNRYAELQIKINESERQKKMQIYDIEGDLQRFFSDYGVNNTIYEKQNEFVMFFDQRHINTWTNNDLIDEMETNLLEYISKAENEISKQVTEEKVNNLQNSLTIFSTFVVERKEQLKLLIVPLPKQQTRKRKMEFFDSHTRKHAKQTSSNHEAMQKGEIKVHPIKKRSRSESRVGLSSGIDANAKSRSPSGSHSGSQTRKKFKKISSK